MTDSFDVEMISSLGTPPEPPPPVAAPPVPAPPDPTELVTLALLDDELALAVSLDVAGSLCGCTVSSSLPHAQRPVAATAVITRSELRKKSRRTKHLMARTPTMLGSSQPLRVLRPGG
jgi:hypothetical protein